MKHQYTTLTWFILVFLYVVLNVGMMNLDQKSCRIFFEILDSRDQNGSTIFISQYPVKNWYSLFENATYADASLSRATGKGYRLDIKGKDYRKLKMSVEIHRTQWSKLSVLSIDAQFSLY